MDDFMTDAAKIYTGLNNYQELIVNFYTQITRSNPDKIEKLGAQLHNILSTINTEYNIGKISKKNQVDMLSIMYKMIGFTRDIVDGKGEYMLTYMMIYEWYTFYPFLAEFALSFCVISKTGQPYGCWKDIKYFCNYCKMRSTQIDHELIKYAIMLTNEQLKKDVIAVSPSLLAKWIPREKSNKFGWLFEELAVDYFKEYMLTVNNPDKQIAAMKKCFSEYRIICSSLNRKLDTTQIKQCLRQWCDIVPTKQTSITMHKQKNAFLNKTYYGMQRSTDDDRIECAEHFKKYVNININNNKEPSPILQKEDDSLLNASTDYTSWKQLITNLLNPRYQIMEEKLMLYLWQW